MLQSQLSNTAVFVLLGFLLAGLDGGLVSLSGWQRLAAHLNKDKSFYLVFRLGIALSLAIAMGLGYYHYGVSEVHAQLISIAAGSGAAVALWVAVFVWCVIFKKK